MSGIVTRRFCGFSFPVPSALGVRARPRSSRSVASGLGLGGWGPLGWREACDLGNVPLWPPGDAVALLKPLRLGPGEGVGSDEGCGDQRR